MFIPKVIFRYAYPFDEERRQLFLKKDLGSYPDGDIVRERANEWQSVWNSFNENDKTVRRLAELCGNTYPHDIEVYVFGDGMNPMSVPFLIPIMRRRGAERTNEELIEITVHELAHNFISVPENRKASDVLRSPYQDESISTKNHLLVYALVQIILSEIFGEEKMRILINLEDTNYQRAIDIVDEVGPENILQKFREAKSE